jgi:hypothetical protein
MLSMVLRFLLVKPIQYRIFHFEFPKKLYAHFQNNGGLRLGVAFTETLAFIVESH